MSESECPNCGAVSDGVCRRCLLDGVFTQESELFELPDKLGGFRVRERIGRGASGEVWLAFQPGPDREVALKVFLDPRLGGVADRSRFMAEAQALGKLDHSGIVPVYATGEEAGFLFIASRWMPGGTLADRRGKPAKNKSECRRIAADVAKIARAAAHAHQHGLVHRDIKPANVLLDANQEPCLADFGIAVADSEEGQGFTSGTPAYMAPEQATGEVTTTADIYSLGALMFDLLTGNPPPSLQEDKQKALTNIDPELASICLRCLEFDPDDRYDSAGFLAKDLDRWLEGRPVAAHPVGPMVHVSKWAKRKPGVATLAGVALLTALSLVIILLVGSDALRRERNHAVEQEELAVESALKATTLADRFRNHAYAADMYASSQARQDGQFGLAQNLLDRHLPKPDEPDVRGFEWYAYQALMKGTEKAIFKNHEAAIIATEFSHDGKFLASSSQDGTLVVNHIETGQIVLSLPKKNALKGALEIPLITKLAWQVPEIRNDILNGKLNFDEVRMRGRPSRLGELTSVSWSPDGKKIAIGSVGSYTRIFSFPEGELIALVPTGWTSKIAFTGDGEHLVSQQRIDKHYHIRIHKLTTFELVREISSVEPTFALRDNTLACLTISDQIMHIIDVSGKKPDITWPSKMRCTKLAFVPSLNRLVGINKDSHILRSWATTSGKLLSEQEIDPGHFSAIKPFSKGIIAAGNSQTIQIRKLYDHRPLAVLQGHQDEILDLAISKDEKWIASAGRDRTVRLWEMPSLDLQAPPRDRAPRFKVKYHSPNALSWLAEREDNRIVLGTEKNSTVLPDSEQTRYALSFDQSGKKAATWRDDGTDFILEWWETASGKKLSEHRIPTDALRPLSVKANPTRETFAITGSRSKLKLYDLNSLSLRGTLPATQAKGILRMYLSPDSSLVGYYYWPRSLEIGRINEGWIRKMPLSKGHVEAIVISPDSKLIASGGSENKITIHDIATGFPIRILTGHRKSIKALAFSPDGNTLASSSNDYSLRLWHLPTWRELGTLDTTHRPDYLGFSQDSRQLLTSDSHSGQKNIWLYPGR